MEIKTLKSYWVVIWQTKNGSKQVMYNTISPTKKGAKKIFMGDLKTPWKWWVKERLTRVEKVDITFKNSRA